MRRLALVAAITFAALAVTYVGVANALLSSGEIARLVSKNPEKLRLVYGKATTLWPGRVHVEGLDLRGRDDRVEWQLHLDSADADLSLLALLRRRFSVAKVAVTGVAFRVRFRLAPGDVNADRVARMPPIDGFEAVPILGVPPGESADEGKPWVVDIRGVDAAAVREIWIDAYRVAGDVHAQGGLTLGAEHLALAPTTAAVRGVTLTTGDDLVASDVSGSIDGRLDDVDLGNVEGIAVLRYLTMHSTLAGQMGGLGFVRHFFREGAVTVSGGAGTFRSDVRVARGVLEKGSGSRIELGLATAVIGGHSVQARSQIDVTTGGDDGGAWGEVALGLSDVAFTSPLASRPVATCAAFQTKARVPQLDVALAPKDFSYSWESPRVDVADLRVLDEVLPKDSLFHVEHGTSSFSTRGHGSLLGASAEVGLEADLVMRIWGARAASVAKGTVPLRANFVAGTLDLGGTELALGDPALSGWWGKAKLGTATIRFDAPSVALSASTSAQDGRPFLSFYSSMKGTSPVARTVLGLVPEPAIAAMTAGMHGVVRLVASKGAVDIQELDVQGALSRLRGRLTKRGEETRGELLVEAGPSALGVDFAGDKSSLVLVDAPTWFASRSGRVAHP